MARRQTEIQGNEARRVSKSKRQRLPCATAGVFCGPPATGGEGRGAGDAGKEKQRRPAALGCMGSEQMGIASWLRLAPRGPGGILASIMAIIIIVIITAATITTSCGSSVDIGIDGDGGSSSSSRMRRQQRTGRRGRRWLWAEPRAGYAGEKGEAAGGWHSGRPASARLPMSRTRRPDVSC